MDQSSQERPGRVVVLASGSGTNLQVLLDAAASDWSVVGLVTDRPEARAVERAAASGVPVRTVVWAHYPGRDEFTSALVTAIAELHPDLIVLAGFMRILGPEAIAAYPNRIINLHPSLLPAFPGAHAVRDALAHGVKVTGVTVHFVDERLDHGPIIRQEAVEVLAGDDEATLHARIQRVEHRLLPEVVATLARGELEVVGRIVKGRVTT